ncbi:MAG: HEAT repeat domain-containing protein, partial [Isosphaeraceae bacterium]
MAQVLGLIVAGSKVREDQGQASRHSQAADMRAEATALLVRLLKDRKSEARAAAAEALGECGPGPAPAELVAAADDADRGVRLAVVRSLQRRNGPDDPTVARLLCELIADPGPIADRFQVMKMVQATTWETQDRAMRSLAGLVPHADPAVLPDVIACLGESGPPARSALPVLDKLLDAPEPSTRASAALALLAIDAKP